MRNITSHSNRRKKTSDYREHRYNRTRQKCESIMCWFVAIPSETRSESTSSPHAMIKHAGVMLWLAVAVKPQSLNSEPSNLNPETATPDPRNQTRSVEAPEKPEPHAPKPQTLARPFQNPKPKL